MSQLEWVLKRDGVCMWGLFGSEYSNVTPCAFGLDPHHIENRSQGGSDTPDNLISLCRRHHDDAQARKIKPEWLKSILEMVYGGSYGKEIRT